MKRALLLIVIASLSFAGSGCLGTKVAKHKVKKAVPGAQTKGEKAAKKVSKAGDETESKINRR